MSEEVVSETEKQGKIIAHRLALIHEIQIRIKDEKDEGKKKELEEFLEKMRSSLTDNELMKLPTYMEWFDREMRKSPNYHYQVSTLLHYAISKDYQLILTEIRKMSDKTKDFLKGGSEEFKEAQAIWWVLYQDLLAIRSFFAYKFRLSLPAHNEVMPDHLHTGVLLSEEDFKKYIGDTGVENGMFFQKEQIPEDYVTPEMKASEERLRGSLEEIRVADEMRREQRVRFDLNEKENTPPNTPEETDSFDGIIKDFVVTNKGVDVDIDLRSSCERSID